MVPHLNELGLTQVPQPFDAATASRSRVYRMGKLEDAYCGSYEGQETSLFTVWWTEPSSRSGHPNSVWQTVVAFRQPTVLPVFKLTALPPWYRRIPYLFYRGKIHFSDDPDFSRAYLVTAPDAEGVRAKFSPPVRQFLARLSQVAGAPSLYDTYSPQRRQWEAESLGDWLLLYRYGWRPKAEDTSQFLRSASALARTLRSGVLDAQAEMVLSSTRQETEAAVQWMRAYYRRLMPVVLLAIAAAAAYLWYLFGRLIPH